MIRVGVIGYGYWGPNIVRNFHGLENARVEMVCDKSAAALARVHKTYPGILTTTDPNEVLNSTQIDAVAVITPVWTHYELAKAALEKCGRIDSVGRRVLQEWHTSGSREWW